jgi:hypothetical protein
MIDFIKTNIKNITPNELLKNPLLEFDTTVDNEGEIKNRLAEYKNLKFKIIDEKYININGSVHKYFNGGAHNHNRFTIADFLEVCIDLSEKFNINPYTTYLHNVEFGVNIILPFNTTGVLDSIISYKGLKPKRSNDFDKEGDLIRFPFRQYHLKIYDKGLQFEQDENILRVEIQVKRMEYFKKRGINIICLADLLNTQNYDKLRGCLLKAFNEVLMYDNSIKIKGLPQREKVVLMNGRNPKYWIGLKEQGKEIKKKRARFKTLVLKYGKQDIHQTIHTIIEQNSREITKIDTSTEQKINDYLNQFKNKSVPDVTTFESAETKLKSPQSIISNIGILQGAIIRNCITCGRVITPQKKGSVFCSEKLYGKEAKKCRNRKSNPKNNYLKKEEKLYNGILLFDIREFKKQIAV